MAKTQKRKCYDDNMKTQHHALAHFKFKRLNAACNTCILKRVRWDV